MVFFKSTAAALALAVHANAITISEPKAQYGPVDVSVGDIEISAGGYWSIVDNADNALTGSLLVADGGAFYISTDTNSVNIDVTLNDESSTIKNDGTVSFNAIQSRTTPKYVLVGKSFTNNGYMYLSADGSAGSPTMSITTSSWSNNGLLTFWQNVRSSSGVVTLGASDGSITNDGTICLHAHKYVQTTPIEGSGCIDIGTHSTLNIKNLEVSSNQNIFMETESSNLVVEASTANQTLLVSGFGNSNTIALSTKLDSDKPYEYNSDSGVLVLYSGNSSQSFNIGLGYVQNLFSVTSDLDDPSSELRNAVSYSGQPPNASKPEVCEYCRPLPPWPTPSSTSSSIMPSSSIVPSSSVSNSSSIGCPECTEYTSQITTTDSSGHTVTATEDVLISTDSAGSLYSTTSIWWAEPTDCPECTEYTTVVTTTNSDGKTITATEDILISTDSAGSLYSTTSSWWAEPAECHVCAEYTTVVTTIDSHGQAATCTQEIVVSTDSNGSLYSSTHTKESEPESTTYATLVVVTNTQGGETSIPAQVVVSTDVSGTPHTTIVASQESSEYVPGTLVSTSKPAASVAPDVSPVTSSTGPSSVAVVSAANAGSVVRTASVLWLSFLAALF